MSVGQDIRSKILREMIGNTLVHREFTSALTARLIIERDQMFTENANKAVNPGVITLENLKPYSKNPIIANFFHQIGRDVDLVEQLGSGMRRMLGAYTPDIFRYTETFFHVDFRFAEKILFRHSAA